MLLRTDADQRWKLIGGQTGNSRGANTGVLAKKLNLAQFLQQHSVMSSTEANVFLLFNLGKS